MKMRAALIAAALFVAIPALAQTPAPSTQQKPPAPHQPGVAAAPAAKPTTEPGTKAPAPPPSADDAKIDPAKEAAIRHLMDVTQTSKLGENIGAYITNQVRSVMSRAIAPDSLAKFMDTFNQKLAVSSPPSKVTDAAVPIYARVFSMEDVQGLTQFYESPLGQKVIKTLPQVSQETQQAGVEIEQKAAMEVLQAMSNDYPELKQMLQAQAPAPSSTPAPQKAPAPGAAPATPAAPTPAPVTKAPPAPQQAPHP
ncbi:MAG TPA: DUF2059 domain-containing protein [Candidatus Acidoferrales bacterium]|nr:DUF2059 domain-containing protein [Candidatus Acidoferrales bacterium]